MRPSRLAALVAVALIPLSAIAATPAAAASLPAPVWAEVVPGHATASDIASVDGTIFFAGDTEGGDSELFKVLDGESVLMDLNPTTSSGPRYLTDGHDGYLYFIANGADGEGLYRTDGGTTTQLVDFEDESMGDASDLVAAGGYIAISAVDPNGKRELFAYDTVTTDGGWRATAFTEYDDLAPDFLTVDGTVVYMSGDNSMTGCCSTVKAGLWRVDLSQPTAVPEPVILGSGSGIQYDMSRITPYDGGVAFTAWRYDTENTWFMVLDGDGNLEAVAETNSDDIAVMGAYVAFSMHSYDEGDGVFALYNDGDGVSELDVNPSGSDDVEIVAGTDDGSRVFFTSNTSDGWRLRSYDADGFHELDTNGPAEIYGADRLAVGDDLYLGVYTDATGNEPWFVDGAEGFAYEIRDIDAGSSSDPHHFVLGDGAVYFIASADGTDLLFRTFGTEDFSAPSAPRESDAGVSFDADGNLHVNWEVPEAIGGHEVLSYDLAIYTGSPVGSATVPAEDCCTHTFEDLDAGTRYYVSIAAVNAVGTSDVLELGPFVYTPPPGTPADAAVVVDGRDVTVTWLASPSDDVTGYEVALLDADDVGTTNETDAQTLTSTFADVEPGTYTAYVTALTADARSASVELGDAVVAVPWQTTTPMPSTGGPGASPTPPAPPTTGSPTVPGPVPPRPPVVGGRSAGGPSAAPVFIDPDGSVTDVGLPPGAPPAVAAAVAVSPTESIAVSPSGQVSATNQSHLHGSITGRLNDPIVTIGLNYEPAVVAASTAASASDPSWTVSGYWLVAADGGVFSFGDARFYGSTGARKLNAAIVSMASTPTGNGYWLVASDGGVFSFGDARFHGSGAGTGDTYTGAAPTATGRGYWLITDRRTLVAYGDAR